MTEKIEFIESYIKNGYGDYQWNDNHGELIRCKDCKHHRDDTRCNNRIGVWFDDDYCSDAERKEE